MATKSKLTVTNEVGNVLDWNAKAKQCRTLNPTELLSLLRMNIMVFFSWGTRDYTVDNRKDVRMFRMQVNGFKHKGFVYIFLNGMDLFDVYLTNFNDKIVKIGSDLYCDQLTDWIDENIEKQSNYKF